MPGASEIKWTASQLELLRKAVRNFNKRRGRFIKKHPDLADLQPETAYFRKLKESIYSARDLAVVLRSLEAYTAETAQPVTNSHGVTTTIWKAAEVRKAVRRENYRRQKAAEKQRKIFVNGEQVSTAEEAQTKNEYKKLKKEFNDFKNDDDFNKYFDYVQSLTDKKFEQDDPADYAARVKKALSTEGFGNEIDILTLYDTLGGDAYRYAADGYLVCTISFIYDKTQSYETRAEVMRRDLPPLVERSGKVKQFIDNLRGEANVDSSEELRSLWDFLGSDRLWEAYKHDYLITYPDDLYRYINDNQLADEYKEYLNKG